MAFDVSRAAAKAAQGLDSSFAPASYPVPFAPLELLSPARDFETARAAILHGADAVYMGGPAFGARRAAGNSFEDLARVADLAHHYRARLYMTLNTLVYDNEIAAAVEAAHKAKEAGVDALIIQDLGLLEAGLPDIEIHASTQCDIRTPEKAAFLDGLGFAQVVPVRELTLTEIRAMRQAMPRARIEFFIAGSLCVSYSGKCYLSAALTGRSANRGECSQPCRLPYDVQDLFGRQLAGGKHVLSLKDNDQSANLEALIEAGVSSFKIEGRLKGPEYVKNLTAFYRRRLDAIIDKHAGQNWTRASLGESVYTFEPDPAKTFHRGATDYFVNGREGEIAALDTPKSTGEVIGRVAAVNLKTPQSVDIRTRETIANGDGLVYLTDEGDLEGLHVNRAAVLKPGLVRIFLHEPLSRHPDVRAGLTVNRNKDHRFEKLLSQESAVRTIGCELTLASAPESLTLTARAAGRSVSVTKPLEVQAAQKPDALDKLKASLAKTGGTIFRADTVDVVSAGGPAVPFVPVSVVNALRREALEGLTARIVATHPASHRLPKETAGKMMAGQLLDFRANAANELTVRLFKNLGALSVADAFEKILSGKTGAPKAAPAAKPAEGSQAKAADQNAVDLSSAPLMECRHCIRRTLRLCPKQFGKNSERKEEFKRMNGGKMKPLPLILTASGGTRLIARFDCRVCEMTVSLMDKDQTAADILAGVKPQS